MEKSKKAKLYQNISSFGVKVARLPHIGNVEDQLCDYKNRENYQNAVLSAENHAFEKLKTQRILLVERDFEPKTVKLF